MFSNRSKFLMLPAVIILLLLPVVNLLKPFGFFFEGTLAEQQKWFPHFSFFAFILFKSFYPVMYALVLYEILKGKLSMLPVLSLIVIQSVLLILGMQALGFIPAALYVYLLVSAVLLNCIFGAMKIGAANFLNRLTNSKIIAGSFLFVIYIGLCLSLPRFHPFAKYTMFNKFADNTTVFMLKDCHNSLLPLNTYCNIDGNHLYELYVAINKGHGFRYGDIMADSTQQQIVSHEMLQNIFAALKKPIPSDSVKLMRVNFYFENGKLNSNEQQLYACGVE